MDDPKLHKNDPQQSRPPSTASAVSAICGAIACTFNIFVITSPLGLIFGLIALVCGIAAWFVSRQGKAGLVLTGFSFLILVIWVLSILIPLLVDPTLSIKQFLFHLGST